MHLGVFDGPFDLLLRLIGKRQLDITEVALAQVTDEFLAHLREAASYDLEQVTEFLVVAATLVDLKAARLLPQAEVEDDEDLAVLEARDLLFARLLQYRAFREVAGVLGRMLEQSQRSVPRQVGLDPQLAAVLPEVVLGIGPHRLAELAGAALRPAPLAGVPTDHVHVPRVNVREHAAVILERLCAVGTATFRALCVDCQETLEVVARFLAVLELFREGRVVVSQLEPFGELHVRWVPRPEVMDAPGGEEQGRLSGPDDGDEGADDGAG